MSEQKQFKIHVYPHSSGWAIIYENEKKPSFIFSDANQALIAARQLGKNLNAELIVHNKQGEIQYKEKFVAREESIYNN